MKKPSNDEIEKAIKVLVRSFSAVVKERIDRDLPPEGAKALKDLLRGLALNGWVIAVHECEERVRSITCGAVAIDDYEPIRAALEEQVIQISLKTLESSLETFN